MTQENSKTIYQNIAGYFMFSPSLNACIIVDCLYILDCMNYTSGDDDNSFFKIPVESLTHIDLVPMRFQELGYIPVGVYPSTDLKETYKEKIESYNYVDIPVCTIYEGKRLTNICILLSEWIPTLENLEYAEEQLNSANKNFQPLENVEQLKQKLLGYVTATGRGIVICDMDFLRICNSHLDDESSQIFYPNEEDPDGFRPGVAIDISEELSDKMFPVYGEYKNGSLDIITIAISDAI